MEGWKSPGIRFTPQSAHFGCRLRSLARQPHDLLGNVTESLHQFDLFRAIPCRNGFISLFEDKYSLLCRIGKMSPGR